jgi:DNA-binding transcriptional ArsR family regulator
MLNHMVEYPRAGLDATFAALAHPIRRSIIASLGRGDRRVTDLATGFEVSLAAVSKHVRVLEAAGLAQRTITGRDHHVALDAGPLADAGAWIAAYEAFWDERLVALDRLLQSREP